MLVLLVLLYEWLCGHVTQMVLCAFSCHTSYYNPLSSQRHLHLAAYLISTRNFRIYAPVGQFTIYKFTSFFQSNTLIYSDSKNRRLYIVNKFNHTIERTKYK